MTAYARLTYGQIKERATAWSAVELIAIEHEAGFSRDWAQTQIVTLKQAREYADIKGYSKRWLDGWSRRKAALTQGTAEMEKDATRQI